jgi:hypothetical protein
VIPIARIVRSTSRIARGIIVTIAGARCIKGGAENARWEIWKKDWYRFWRRKHKTGERLIIVHTAGFGLIVVCAGASGGSGSEDSKLAQFAGV